MFGPTRRHKIGAGSYFLPNPEEKRRHIANFWADPETNAKLGSGNINSGQAADTHLPNPEIDTS